MKCIDCKRQWKDGRSLRCFECGVARRWQMAKARRDAHKALLAKRKARQKMLAKRLYLKRKKAHKAVPLKDWIWKHLDNRV